MSDIGDRFAENGFIHVEDVFSTSEVAELEEDFDRIIQQITASDECIDATWDGWGAGCGTRTAWRPDTAHAQRAEIFPTVDGRPAGPELP